MCTAVITALHQAPVATWPILACAFGFLTLLGGFKWSNRKATYIYFDPQDFVHYEDGGGRKLPLAAEKGTFAPLLSNYLDVTKLLITVAAASIAFGGGQHPPSGILIAKIVLSFSILYGVAFTALLQFFYDEYCINVRAYTPFRYSLIQALGFSTLACFCFGYFIWAFNLG